MLLSAGGHSTFREVGVIVLALLVLDQPRDVGNIVGAQPVGMTSTEAGWELVPVST